MGWLKMQKLEYPQNRTKLFYEIEKFLTCASNDTLEKVSFCSRGNLLSSLSFFISPEMIRKPMLDDESWKLFVESWKVFLVLRNF